MNYIHPGVISGLASARSIGWWYNRQIKKGILPVFKKEDAEKALPLPESHPFNNKFIKTVSIFSSIVIILLMFSVPFIFYLIHKSISYTPEMLLFTNTVSVVISIFPSILLAVWLIYTMYMKAVETWPEYATFSYYSSIVGVNRLLNGAALDKTKWERLVKPEHVRTLKEYEEHFYQKLTLWTLIICLPVYTMLTLTYDYATLNAIVTKNPYLSVTRNFDNASQVNINLTFKEVKSEGNYKLQPKVAVTVHFKNYTSYNLCDFSCTNDTAGILKVLHSLRDTYHVPIQIEPLKTYQKELLESDNPKMFLFYEQLLLLGTS